MSLFTHDESLVQESFRLFRRHPKVLVPLVAATLVYVPTVLYLDFGVPWEDLRQRDALLIVFGAVFLFATLLSVCCSVLLELLQDLESGREPSLGRAVASTLRLNLLQMIPIIIVWTVIWFLLVVIQAMLSRKKKRGGSERSFSAENASRALAGGGGGHFSFTAAYFRMLQKLVRMVVFLILPGIAWQGLSFPRAIRRGFTIFRAHPRQFLAAFGMTELVTFMLFLPALLLLYASDLFDAQLPEGVWIGVILYIGCGWMYSIYLEQMYTAQLYLWHMKWEREVARRQATGRDVPGIEAVKRPSLLDRVYELAHDEPRQAQGPLERPSPA
ncbi:MAG TPA: hypothetical protein VMS98_06585 [Thermoanaerobaculia bacterium]|nr:hypothetical protein [Thermoanaerobaculia bacterium]